VPLEGIEAPGPKLAVRREPGVDLGKRFGAQAVAPALRGHPDGDQARFAQHAEVLGDGRLAEVHLLDEVADRPFALAQQIEDGASPRLREHVESVHHVQNMPRRTYSCQGMLGLLPR
jgi:hypothetical protein